MSKKTFAPFILFALLAALGINAQTTSGLVTIPENPMPPISTGDIIQFNNLTVQSVSAQTIPAEIIAVSNHGIELDQNGTPLTIAQPSTTSNTQCVKYEREDSSVKTTVVCPTPASQPVQTPGSTLIYPPTTYPYRIEVSADTRLFLRDRTVAGLGDFAQGDTINVYGFYNADGSVRALIVRNLSKPVQKTFYQLNNVQLVSVSGTTAPATLIVMQQTPYPCYRFNDQGERGVKYPCPLTSQTLQGSATQSLSIPQPLMSMWQMARKYEIRVDSQTLILNNNRTAITLADLKIGDKLNIYGQMTGDNGPIDADIVRDLSQPPAATGLSGRVTTVNADGSFVILTDSGESYTVLNPIRVGATVKVSGILDALQHTISQITQLSIGYKILPNQVLPD